MVKATPTKSRTPFYGILLLLAVAGAGGIYYSVTSGKPKPIELPKGTPLPTAEGYLRGDPNAAITIIEFADFECPGCGQFATVTEPASEWAPAPGPRLSRERPRPRNGPSAT